MEEPPYRCCECKAYFNDLNDHILTNDHSGPLKIGYYCLDPQTGIFGYLSVTLRDTTFQLVKQFIQHHHVRFDISQEAIKVGDSISITTHDIHDNDDEPSELDLTLPADSFFCGSQDKDMYIELMELLPAAAKELAPVNRKHATRIKQMLELIGCGQVVS